MAHHRVCRACWHCGSDQYHVRSTAFSFTHDRECKQCSVWYSPPTPKWVKVTRLVVGGLLTANGFLGVYFAVVLIFFTHSNEWKFVLLDFFASGILLFFGIRFFKRGIADLGEEVTEPIDFDRYARESKEKEGQ